MKLEIAARPNRHHWEALLDGVPLDILFEDEVQAESAALEERDRFLSMHLPSGVRVVPVPERRIWRLYAGERWMTSAATPSSVVRRYRSERRSLEIRDMSLAA